MKKKFLMEVTIYTENENVSDNPMDFLSIDVEDCQMVKCRFMDIVDIEEAMRLQARYPIETQEDVCIEWLCPNCKGYVGHCADVDNYCKRCGQKILFN